MTPTAAGCMNDRKRRWPARWPTPNWKRPLPNPVSTNKEELAASGEVLKFDGFLKVYREDSDEDEVNEEEDRKVAAARDRSAEAPLKEMKAVERFTRPLPRYTEASLVKSWKSWYRPPL